MLAANAVSQYRENEVQTTPGRLIVMLYDGAIRFLEISLDALRNGDMPTRTLHLGKANRILCELISCLDMSAGEIAADLFSIYRYCLERLLIAQAEDREEHFEEVIRLLSSLRDAWDQAERSIRVAQYEAPSPALLGAAR